MEASLLAGVLSASPLGPVAAFLRVAQVVGVKWRILSQGRFVMWLKLGEVENLWWSERARKFLGLEQPPKTWEDLRKLVHFLRGLGRSYQEICDHMEANWICTAAGLREWRRSTILQYLNAQDEIGERFASRKLDPGPIFKTAWARFVMDRLLVHLFAFAPMALVEFSIGWGFDGDRIVIDSEGSVPDAIRDWAIARMGELAWLHPHDWSVSTLTTATEQTSTPE